MLSVSVDRTGLELSALVIGDDPSASLWIPEDGLGRFGKTWRRKRAASNFMHRSIQTHAVLDDDSIPLAVYATAATTATLDALRDEVEAAFFQWAFDFTISEDGVVKTYPVNCADVKWNDYDSGMTAAKLSRASISIPLDA